MEDWLFYGGVELLAVLICAPFALRQTTAAAARLVGIVGVLAAGVAITLVIGLIMDDWNLKTGLTWIFLPLVTAPISLVVGAIAGAYFGKRVRLAAQRETLPRR
jgi:hypothetical protein